MREKLKKNQPIAYRILENSLLNDKLSHAFLFYGDRGCGKLDAAIFLAQSILCDEKGFACEQCDTCARVKERNYTDMILVDGANTTIKKEAILSIQEEFSKTALEAKGKKIYILNLVENATPDALNTLLKFLEEPVKDVYAILISEKLDGILPTIVSRCQPIPFVKAKLEDCLNFAKEQEMDELDAYLCSHMVSSMDQILSFSEEENYQCARILAMEYLETWKSDKDMAILNLQINGNDKKGEDREQMVYFTEILMIFYRDVIRQASLCESEKWKTLMKAYDRKESMEYLKICRTNKDAMNKSINIKLWMDAMMFQMKEVS